MSIDIAIGTVMAGCYTVLQVKTVPVPTPMTEYVNNALQIELDAKYENHSRLSIYTLKGPVPPAGEWPFLVPDGWTDIRVKRTWTPSRINPPCGAITYNVRSPQGTRIAMVQVMAACESAFVLAQTSWAGFPGVNRFFVGIKPGMEERTEGLLEAGLRLCQ